MSVGRRSLFAAVACALATLCACEFNGAEDMTPIKMNSCASSANCEAHSACVDALCVADAAKEPLKIALQVTPLPTSVAAQALPIVLEPFEVAAPVFDRPFDLPEATRVYFRVVAQGLSIEANVTFTPVNSLPGVPAKSITVAAPPSVGQTRATNDVVVQLLSRVGYRMLVLPTDTRLPPASHVFTALDSGQQTVDYDTLATREQALTITGDAADRDLLVTAFDKVSGEPISSTATVTKGKATLVFSEGSEEVPFRLQIRASQSFEAKPAANEAQCDTDTPAFPTFSIDGPIAEDDEGTWNITLPKLPERIRYEGTVELCPEEQGNASKITVLPITLQSRSLQLDKATPSLRASFDATTSATYDKDANALRFCVQAMPGEYYVRATPPTSMRCALFAELVPIQAPKDKAEAIGATLSLPRAARLTGVVKTSTGMPLSNTSVEARALGLADVVELPPGDLSVTTYNRSNGTLTDSFGNFSLSVDVGSYDFVFKPLADSGFPWQVRTKIMVGLSARESPFNTEVIALSPVVVTGLLRYAGTGEAAQAAEIEAYALIPVDPDNPEGEERAVPIGKTMGDADGRFTLLLPVSIGDTW